MRTFWKKKIEIEVDLLIKFKLFRGNAPFTKGHFLEK